ncbi:protein C3orf33 [Culicoides brevitarsis]|uniref:protein C3orf33 n=1 Tax=Culicoides brevitarsis TaxID=469753 RepID=UPI00307BB175
MASVPSTTTSTSSDNKTLYERFVNYMERNTKGVEIGVYATSGLLFAVAYYKIRPITKFCKPSDIPRHFIKNRLPQNGKVVRLEPSLTEGPLLRVSHKPLVNIFFASKKTLPVKIAGIELNSNGYSWLQSIVCNQNVKFIPLTREGVAAECQVLLLDAKNPSKQPIDVAKALLSLGFAKLEPTFRCDVWHKESLEYYEILKNAQKKAKSRRNGLWYEALPQPAIHERLMRNLWQYVTMSLTPQHKRLPELIR